MTRFLLALWTIPAVLLGLLLMLGGVLVEGSQNIIGGLSPNDGSYICANNGWGVEVRGPASGFFASSLGASALPQAPISLIKTHFMINIFNDKIMNSSFSKF